MMTFYRWLMRQKRRDDPVGDLARDSRGASVGNDVRAWLAHLQGHRACEVAYKALQEGWMEYVSAVLGCEVGARE